MANRIARLTPQTLRPTAAPRDTFVTPNAGAGLGQLADSLSQFAPSLSRFGAVVAQERGEKDKLEGENKAREFVEAHQTYKQALEAGLIEKKHSPFYRMGAYETFGRASAYRFQDDFRKALDKSPVKESTTPGDFDKFEGDFRNKWMADNLGENVDPFMQAAFGRTADNLINGDRSNFSTGAAARLEGQVSESFQAEVFSIAKLGYEAHATPDQVLDSIQLAMDRQIAGHMDKRIVNENVALAIVSAARRLNDTSVLDLMDNISVGSGTLAGVARFAKLREEAENQIAAVNQAKYTHEAQESARRQREAVDAVTADFVTALQKDPTVDLEPFVSRLVAAGDADKASTYIAMQKAYTDREYMDVPPVKQRLLIGVHTGYTNMARLDSALAAKSITFQTYQALAQDVKERDKTGRDTGEAKVTSGMERVRSRVRALFVAEYGASSVEQRYRAEAAASEAVANWLDWRKSDAGKTADKAAEEEWVHKETTRQFGLKASADDSDPIKDADIPDAQFGGPQPVNPKKAPAIERSLYEQLKTESERGNLSPASIRAMKTLGIAADPKALKKFLDAQAQFMGSN